MCAPYDVINAVVYQCNEFKKSHSLEAAEKRWFTYFDQYKSFASNFKAYCKVVQPILEYTKLAENQMIGNVGLCPKTTQSYVISRKNTFGLLGFILYRTKV